MINYESLMKALMNLKNVTILSEEKKDNLIFFKRDSTAFILSISDESEKAVRSDFSLTFMFQPKEIQNNELSYISILEAVNSANQTPGNLCTFSYRKKVNIILIEINHILFSQDTPTFDEFHKANLDKYLPLALLGMIILLLQSVKQIAKIISKPSHENEELN
ncbi:hypothetical protein E2X65_21505 [Salmonella enterica]|nr:hypothetical protein [Salmonella enterica]